MRTELLHDRALLYVTGAMAAPERESFEVLLEYLDELRSQVAALQEAAAAVSLAARAAMPVPPEGLRKRILTSATALPHPVEAVALVVTGPDGLVEWVNPAFTALCGYTLPELKGRKPGHLLQGPATDQAGVARIREALRQRRPCRETLVNYHKDGSSYRADIRIAPVLDDAGEPVYFVARESRVPEMAGTGS